MMEKDDGGRAIAVVLAVLFVVGLGVVGGGFAYTVAARERAAAEEARVLAESFASAASHAAGEPDPSPEPSQPGTAGPELSALERERARVRELEAEVRSLRRELGVAENERLEREMAWLDFTSAVATLDIDTSGGEFVRELLSETPGAIEEEPIADPAQVARAERSAAMHRSLRALLAAEWVHGIDLLDIGLLSDPASEGWIGPVVFRLLDDTGRLSGSLFAERFRLEGSKSGHVVTLVLEEGHERHEGESFPFRGGIRRILLPGVDPGPFIDTLPELFSEEDERGELDDGLWDLARVERDLNLLLEQDATGDVYRVRHIGAVRGTVLHDVHVEVRSREGTVLRRLFADVMRVSLSERGVQIVLEDGVTLRGDSRAPFLDGRYRIFLPRARHEAWTGAHLPGVSATVRAAGPPSEELEDGPASEEPGETTPDGEGG